MDTEVIDDVEYPKGAWAQLEAAMVCAGHSPHAYLRDGYTKHVLKCRVCGSWWFVHRVCDRAVYGQLLFSAGIRPCPSQREDV